MKAVEGSCKVPGVYLKLMWKNEEGWESPFREARHTSKKCEPGNNDPCGSWRRKKQQKWNDSK